MGLLLSLLIVIAALAYRTIGQLQSNSQSVAHAQEVLEALERLASTVKDAETGHRGYLLTGKDEYLAPYNAARPQLHDEIERIADLTADNPSQQARIPQLRNLISDKLDGLAKKVALRREGNPDAALQLVQSDEGRLLMEEIRSLVNQMEEDERDLLSDRKWANGHAFRAAFLSAMAIGFFGLVALAVYVRLLLRRSSSSLGRQPPSANDGNGFGQSSSAPRTA